MDISSVALLSKIMEGNIDSNDENKEVLKKYTELWDGIGLKMKLKQ